MHENCTISPETDTNKPHRPWIRSFLKPTESGYGQLIRFGMSGGMATLVDCTVMMTMFVLVGLSHTLSVAIGYGAGLTVCYTCSILWIFPHRAIADRRLEFTIFVAIGLVGLVLTEAVVHGSLHLQSQMAVFAHISDAMRLSLAKGMAIVLVFFFNFCSRKFILFRRPSGG